MLRPSGSATSPSRAGARRSLVVQLTRSWRPAQACKPTEVCRKPPCRTTNSWCGGAAYDITHAMKHGGDISRASAQFGKPNENWLDLSTAIAPAPYPLPPIPDHAWRKLAALADRDRAAAAPSRDAQQAARLDETLKSSGLEIMAATLLCRRARHPRLTPLHNALAGRGILTRRFAHQPTWPRFALPGSTKDHRRLATALQACRAIIEPG